MTGRNILFALFVFGCVSLSLARGGGHRGRGKPHLMGAACLAVNVTSGETIKERACPEGVTCTLGPLSQLDCYGNTIQGTFCSGVPEPNQESTTGRPRCKRPDLADMACRLLSADGSIDETRACEDGTCSVGPLTVDVEGTEAVATFCQPAFSEGCPEPRERPPMEGGLAADGEPSRRGGRGGRPGRGGRGGRRGGDRPEVDQPEDEEPEGDQPEGEGPAEGGEAPPSRLSQGGRGGRGGPRGGRGGRRG